MSSQRTRIAKEARALFWTWCAVTLAGLLTWLPHELRYVRGVWIDEGVVHRVGSITGFLTFVSSMGFWIGVPLLATLAFGNDFQYRTLPLLLSQPIDRMKVWKEKLIVTTIAALTIAFVYSLGRQDMSKLAVVWMVTALCSATFWTLVARSIIGGLVLNLFQGTAIVMTGQLMKWMQWSIPSSPTIAAAISYGIFMLWMGRRKLLRFEMTDGIGGDLLLISPRGFLRCRSTGVFANLIRKEVRLLWPVWMLTLVCVAVVVFLGALQLLPGISSARLASLAIFLIFGLNGLSTVLAGCISMGEERTSGTHSWHMTLPMSARLQWLLKLTAAVLAAVVPLAFTILIAELTFGDLFTGVLDEHFQHHDVMEFLLLSAVVAFAAFWSGCAVQGTVRAALLVFPVLGAMQSVILAILSIGGPLLISGVLDPVVLRLHPFPFEGQTTSFILKVTAGRFAPLWFIVPALVLMFFQTYGLFRREVRGSLLSGIRCLIPVVIVIVVVGGGSTIPFLVVSRAEQRVFNTLKETHDAVGKLTLNLNAERPQQIAAEDLARTSQLAPATRRLLNNATIRVLPRTGDPRWFERYHIRSEYFTLIHFSNNWDCTAYGRGFFSCTTPTGRFGFPMTPP